jgi:hypothetical protein
LKADLEKMVPEERILVKPLQGHVLLRGNYVEAVREWMTAKGF